MVWWLLLGVLLGIMIGVSQGRMYERDKRCENCVVLLERREDDDDDGDEPEPPPQPQELAHAGEQHWRDQ